MDAKVARSLEVRTIYCVQQLVNAPDFPSELVWHIFELALLLQPTMLEG
jgi:hypothetical protein